MLTVLRDRATSGVLLGGGAVVLLASMVIGWSMGPLPDGADGSNAANMGLTSILFLGPLTAGVAAAQAGRDARGGLHAVASASARGAWGGWIVLVVAASLWTGLAYLGIVLAAFFRGTSGTVRAADLTVVGAALSLVVLCAALGAAWGSRWTGARGALGVTLLAFGVLYGGGYLEIWSARWATAYPGTAFPIHLRPNVGLNLGKCILALSGAAVLLAPAARPRPRTWWRRAGAVGMVAGVALVALSPDWPAVEASTTSPTCQSASGFTVCAWPQQADRLPGTLAALEQLDRLVGDSYPVPAAYRQIGAGQRKTGEVPLGTLAEPGRTETIERVMAELAVRSLPSGDCDTAEAAAARNRLSGWLQSTTQGLAPVGGPVTTDDVRDWVRLVRGCSR